MCIRYYHSTVGKAFLKLGKDRDGRSTTYEARQLLRKGIGDSLTESQLWEICRLCDVDDDGRFTREEV